MLLETAEYKKDVIAAARIANLFWTTTGTAVEKIVDDAIDASVQALVEKYRAEAVEKYQERLTELEESGTSIDEAIAQAVRANIESAKCNL